MADPGRSLARRRGRPGAAADPRHDPESRDRADAGGLPARRRDARPEGHGLPAAPAEGPRGADAADRRLSVVRRQQRLRRLRLHASRATTIRARMQKREDLGADDLVGVYLDTFHDRQRAYFFFSTPLGIQGDGIISETGGEDTSFDTQWDSRGKLTDDGYVVLITRAVQGAAVSGQGRAGLQEWGLALVRVDPVEQRDRLLAGQHAARERLHRAVRHRRRHRRRLAGPQHPDHPLRHVHRRAVPRCGRRRLRDAERGPRRRRREARAARRASTLDFTINPDFSQVESDEPQVTVNQRFEVFFPEKRPFFLENSDFFDARR